jgi:hypothetical protein
MNLTHLKSITSKVITTAVAAVLLAISPKLQSVDEAIAQANAENKLPQMGPFSCVRFAYTSPDENGVAVITTPWVHNLTTTAASGYTNANDWLAKEMGNGPSSAFASASGNATATTATSLTNSGATFPTSGQGLAGCLVFAMPNNSGTGSRAYGVIVSNTGTALTIDQWYDPTSTTGAAGTTPNATANYIVAVGQNPAAWLAVTSTSFTPANTDTTLSGELTSNGFTRAVGTYGHTAAGSTYTLSHQWTATGTQTINNEAVFGACNTTGGGVMPFESAEPSPPTLVSGDTLTNTVTITI